MKLTKYLKLSFLWYQTKMGKDTKKIVLNILGIFVISRLLILFIGYLSNLVIIKGKWYGTPTSLLDLFFTWDSRWYMSIIDEGYHYIPGKESSIGFFPLYPLLIKTFSLIFGNPKLIGFIISNIALLAASIYLYKLIKLDFKDSIAFKTVFYMLIFPLSFFFSIFYTEGIFLFLTISCFYYARKKKWLAASVLGFFLSLTRSLGFLMLLPILVEYLDIDFKNFKIDKKKVKKDMLYLLLIPSGLLSFMAYSYIKFGDFLAYFHSKSAWGNKLTSIFTTLNSVRYYEPFYKLIFIGSLIFALIFIIYLIYYRVRISYIIYSSLFLFAYLSVGILEGIPRYVSILFPLYLGMSLASKNKFLSYFLTLFSIALLTLFTILFVNGFWFT